jgi:hypothetical protein
MVLFSTFIKRSYRAPFCTPYNRNLKPHKIAITSSGSRTKASTLPISNVSVLLWYCTMSLSDWCLTFWDYMVVLSSRVNVDWKFLHLTIEDGVTTQSLHDGHQSCSDAAQHHRYTSTAPLWKPKNYQYPSLPVDIILCQFHPHPNSFSSFQASSFKQDFSTIILYAFFVCS